MQISSHAVQSMQCTPQAAFDLCTDAARFPDMFRGFGPIPAVRAVVPNGPLAVGMQRRIENSDGTVLQECITALEPPHRHDYTLDGFRAPFSWLVRSGESAWRIEECPVGTRVRWDYRFTLTSTLAWPLAAVVLRVFMTGAMQRCLAQMARALESPSASPRGSA